MYVYVRKWIVGFTGYAPMKSLVRLDCTGSGSKNDPYLINESINPPNQFIIKNSNNFIQINDCYFSQIYLENCNNITFNTVDIKDLYLKKSSNFRINHSSVSQTLSINRGDNFKINDCVLNRLFLRSVSSERNYIQNCKINALELKNSDSNTIKDNKISALITKKAYDKLARENIVKAIYR